MTYTSHKSKKQHTLRPIELLAPAKNLECGIVAIDHGADAVYIGAKDFGARQAAGNEVSDIAKLAAYAHQFGAKVYVTVNTIVYENELSKAKSLLENLVLAEVDAILVQDMAVVQMMREISEDERFKGKRFPQLHASTQTDNRNSAKVGWLASVGFDRVVLARELSLEEITAIHNDHPDVELEVFVHGALCVSYSGACYASQHCFSRSANRGECAQFCRHAFDLKDSQGKTIIHDSYLLSLKDLNQLSRLEEIVEAGATSLKIEGRLKDAAYVKNVVAAYNGELDRIIEQHPDKYCRSSYGKVKTTFTPNINKTFNRGFTNYFLDKRRDDISSMDTPKAMGEYVGYVKEIRHGSFNVAGTATFANGDGLCFFDKDRKLEGFRVNRVDNNRLYPLSMPASLKPGMALYRNNDIEFERQMEGRTAERKLALSLTLSLEDGRVCLSACDEMGRKANTVLDEDVQEARTPQEENIKRQLSKLGNTIFSANQITICKGVGSLFVPSSKLAAMRRDIIEKLEAKRMNDNTCQNHKKASHNNVAKRKAEEHFIEASKINASNVANHMAETFYEENGVVHATTAYETTNNSRTYGTRQAAQPLMTCRYCLRYAMGYCVKRGGKQPTWKEPLFIQSSDGRQMRLAFNCAKCQMEVYPKE